MLLKKAKKNSLMLDHLLVFEYNAALCVDIFIRFSITGSISTAIDQVPKYTSEYLCAFFVKTVTFVAILELFY